MLEIFDREKNKETLVFPGTRLGVIEEFYAGPGTYIDDGYIYAAIPGKVVIDKLNYEVSIMQSKNKKLVQPVVGSICLGTVVSVSKQMINIAIYYVNNVEVYPTYSCLLHVSQASRAYLETADEAVALGDVVRVKIIDAKTIPIQCTMADSHLGVVISYCSRCGNRLEKIGRNKLRCNECGNIENRKTAIDYGHSALQFKL
ncbi:MAG: exosome complex RNA-binding protein Csl4 [Candidatus Heimdallarchaeum endolithica]|uniref:Exosome complex component Csl4 n=1 Tax=Candidatus Heimdallarchaeum endolithica TaxID=2876572 RepID=A0A9Y1FMV0_9ARCH|nr:MAG: exosome complex RNA-binding protein Csl4 [Candidatus Heimdallarchaeum endolithica]